MLEAGNAVWMLAVAACLFLLALEARFPIHPTSDGPKGRLLANFGLGLVNAALFVVVPLSSVVAAAWAARQDVGLINLIPIPTAVAFAATILLRSLLAYILHVAAHRIPLLWRMHRVHHADTAVDLSTGFRHHPLELAFVAACHALFAVGLGLSAPALMVYEASAIILTLWTHANLQLPPLVERVLATLFITPAIHHVHHSAQQPETDSNYGELLSLWDRLFGTLRRLDENELRSLHVGLGPAYDSEAAHLLRQLALPFRTPVAQLTTGGAANPSDTDKLQRGTEQLGQR